MACGASLTSTLPACISETRSHSAASFMKWVETKIVTLSWRDRSARISQNRSRATGSTPEVGSSRISISGAWIIATASDRRCRMPSGRASGSASMASSRPKRLAISAMRAGIVAGGKANSLACSSRFWCTVNSV